MEPGHLFTDYHGLEQGLGAAEALGADVDGLAVGEFVGFVILV